MKKCNKLNFQKKKQTSYNINLREMCWRAKMDSVCLLPQLSQMGRYLLFLRALGVSKKNLHIQLLPLLPLPHISRRVCTLNPLVQRRLLALVKQTVLCSVDPSFKPGFQECQLIAQVVCRTYLTSLSLHFLICKRKIIHRSGRKL